MAVVDFASFDEIRWFSTMCCVKCSIIILIKVLCGYIFILIKVFL